MQNDVVLEISLDSVESAIEAEKGGAQRIELCGNLNVGGITPSAGMIRLTRKAVSIPLFAMIRPRGGNFCYSESELEVMKTDIVQAKELGANGIVTGILTSDRSIDVETMQVLLNLAKPMEVTFHRAFDVVNDPRKALNDLIKLGVNRILTSGQAETALRGVELISELIRFSKEQIIVMPGCGINAENIQAIKTRTGAHEFHIGSSVRKNMNSNGSELKLGFGASGLVESKKVSQLLNLALAKK